MPVMYFHEVAKESGGHTAVLTRGPMIIYVDCSLCSFSTIWHPDETTQQVAGRWNKAHSKKGGKG